jgi:uncharacterized protein (TIGR03437 family)
MHLQRRANRYGVIPNGCTRRQFGAVITGAAFGAVQPARALDSGAPWSVVIVPDPQYLARDNTSCSLYERMIQWAVDNKNLIINGAPLNLKGFIQLGDCQNDSLATVANSQEVVAVNAWSRATTSNMFVAWCCGNHDYESGGTVVDRRKIGHVWRTDSNGAWSPANLAAKYGGGLDLGSGDFALWGGIYEDPTFPQSSVNNYIRLQVGLRKVLVIALEFFPRSAVLNWAKGLHDKFVDHEVWVTTHGYMDILGNLCDRSGYGPGTYRLAVAPASNSGAEMWAGSDISWPGFSTWPRLALVTCGHWIDGYSQGWVWQQRRDTGAAGQTTLQLFCDTQNADLTAACSTSRPDAVADVAHLMLLRVWPTSCETYLLSTNTGKWTGARGVRASTSPVQLFSVPFISPAPNASPAPIITGIASAAGAQNAVQSGSWISIYGTSLASSSRTWQVSDFSGDNLPITLDGVSVRVNGKPGAVYYVSPGQLNVLTPTDNVTGPVPVEVTNGFGVFTTTVFLQPYAPAFFTFQQKYVAAVHADGVYVAPAGYFGTSVTSRPARPGETLSLFGTGFGPTSPAVPAGRIVRQPAVLANPAQLQIYIGGVQANILYAGLVSAGEYQFNIVVPFLPEGDQSVIASIAGILTQSQLSILIG